MFEEAEGYIAFIANHNADILARDPNTPKEWLLTPKFRPEVLNIRRNEGEAPRHASIRWGSKEGCTADDVKILQDYLESKDRNIHINTGVHGKIVNG